MPVRKEDEKRCKRCRWWVGDPERSVATLCLSEDARRLITTCTCHRAWMPAGDFGCRYWAPIPVVEGISDPVMAGKYLDDDMTGFLTLAIKKERENRWEKKIKSVKKRGS